MYQLLFSVVGLRSSNKSVVSNSERVSPESEIILLVTDTKKLLTAAHKSLSVWSEHYFLNKHSWLTITVS